MHKTRVISLVLTLCLCLSALSHASAYNGRPKLVVVIVIDQFRGDYLERGHDEFGPGGFRLLTDKGAWFTDCNYQYANTRTAPGHATLFTGTYISGHGIQNNEWWDATRRKMVSSVEDDATQIVGVSSQEPGASPHNLLSDTIGDELRLATDGKSRVFAISLKDRAAVLPAGFSGTAYWTDHVTGAMITSTYYMKQLPEWVQGFDRADHAGAYWNREWKVGEKVLGSTSKPASGKANWYDIVGGTPFANQYELEFARELIAQEKLGQGATTDLLIISLSANDILGHRVGPNSEESRAMTQALDHDLADFFGYIGQQIGLGNVWIALSADHGVSPAPSYVSQLHIPGGYLGPELRTSLNEQLKNKLSGSHISPKTEDVGHQADSEFVPKIDWPLVFLNPDAFAAVKVNEADAERMVAEFFRPYGIRGYYTRVQLANHDVPPDTFGRKYLNSLSPRPGWLVFLESPPFTVGGKSGTDHAMPYSYDTHVPLAFFGLAFQPGVYRGHCEPVDMAVTLSNLLGINSPSAAVGRVLTEALQSSKAEGTR